MIKYVLIAVIILLIIALAAYIVASYNKFTVLKNRMEEQGAQIDVQLKRRVDLIPNLIESVKEYARYEEETIRIIVKARSEIICAKDLKESWLADQKLERPIKKIFAIAEKYPDLKANKQFLNLQRELKETEDRIAKTRQFYNDTILIYNNKIQVFPANILAGIMGFERKDFLQRASREDGRI